MASGHGAGESSEIPTDFCPSPISPPQPLSHAVSSEFTDTVGGGFRVRGTAKKADTDRQALLLHFLMPETIKEIALGGAWRKNIPEKVPLREYH